MYNLVKRQAEVEILPMAQALGVAVVPYSPTAGGLLTGKYTGGARPEGARFATNKMYQARYAEPSYWAVAEAFATLASQLGHKPATLAVAWTAAHPAVTSVLLGARTADQLEDTLAAADLDLDTETYARVAALTPTPPPATDRSEESRPAQGSR
jgi:aryl-alcohol dehydrogenase-like predicted oxidoreductase